MNRFHRPTVSSLLAALLVVSAVGACATDKKETQQPAASTPAAQPAAEPAPVAAAEPAPVAAAEPAPAQPAAQPVAEGKPGPALLVTAVRSDGAKAGTHHLVVDVTPKLAGQSLDVEFKLPEGVTAVAPVAPLHVAPAVAGTASHLEMDVAVTPAVAKSGANVLVVAVLSFGGVNKDTVNHAVRVGPAAAAPASAPDGAVHTQDSSGKAIKEVRPGK